MIELLSSALCGQLLQFGRLFVGFSGGLDSSVLLHVLVQQPDLYHKIHVVHAHHGISPHADDWQSHCALLCQQWGLPFISEKLNIDTTSNLEERARKSRYAFFAGLLTSNDALLLAHHQNDQAETVLLQLFRGAGAKGMSAMQAVRPFAEGYLLRPFLSHSRQTLEDYAREHQLSFITDESNQDLNYSRNFLRQTIIPQLQNRWPGLCANLARAADHCLTDQSLLENLAEIDWEKSPPAANQLSIQHWPHYSVARINNMLRHWLQQQGAQAPTTAIFNRLIKEVIFAKPDKIPEVRWANYCVRRFQHHLYLLKDFEDRCFENILWASFPAPLFLPKPLGHVQALSDKACDDATALIIPDLSKVEIRFRQGGETMVYKGQTKQLKKLFQELQIPPWVRARTPLLYINSQLAAIVGHLISDLFVNIANTKDSPSLNQKIKAYYVKLLITAQTLI